MLEYDRIDVSEGTNINKCIKSMWYFPLAGTL